MIVKSLRLSNTIATLQPQLPLVLVDHIVAMAATTVDARASDNLFRAAKEFVEASGVYLWKDVTGAIRPNDMSVAINCWKLIEMLGKTEAESFMKGYIVIYDKETELPKLESISQEEEVKEDIEQKKLELLIRIQQGIETLDPRMQQSIDNATLEIMKNQKKSVPSLFILLPHNEEIETLISQLMYKVKCAFKHRYLIKVLCESETPHVTDQEGIPVSDHKAFVKKVLPIIKYSLKVASVITQAAVSVSLDPLADCFKNTKMDLKIASDLAMKLEGMMENQQEEIKYTDSSIVRSRDFLYQMLKQQGLSQAAMYSGLERRPYKSGYRFLCRICRVRLDENASVG